MSHVDVRGEGIPGRGSTQALRQEHSEHVQGCGGGGSKGAEEAGLEGETGERTGVRAEGDPKGG